jgi:hypothetical protein
MSAFARGSPVVRFALLAAGIGFSPIPALGSLVPTNNVTVTVDAGSVIRTVDDRQFGLNATIWDGEFPSATTTSLLAAAGTRALRFPGGSLSDEYHWATNTTLNNTWTWAMNFDQFATVATALNAHVFVTVNYGTGTPQEAANWVRSANVTKQYGFKYWEVGNECYGTWETDQQAVRHDPFTYANRFKDYMQQMKAVDPTIKVGIVVATGENSFANNTSHPATNPRTGQVHNGWTPVLLATLKALGVTPDFATYHRYDQAPGAESDGTLLQSAQTWPNDAADLRQQLADYLGAMGAGVELVVTENNSVYSNPGKQTTSLINGLFLAESFGNLVKTEFNAMVWWDVRNGQDAANNNSSSLYGWRNYGDYGVMHGPDGTYPTYHVHKLLQHFARGGDQIVAAGSSDSYVSVFAAKRVDGSLSLLVVVKSSGQTSPIGIPWLEPGINFVFTGFTPGAAATLRTYGIPQDQAARVGSAATTPDEGTVSVGPASLSVNLPHYSVSVITIPPVRSQPAFVRQPESLGVIAGAHITLSARATGDAPIAYQWRKNGVPIPGATAETYDIASMTAEDAATYTAVATNAVGSATSSAGALGILPYDGRFANISTRGLVRLNDEIMIAGFVISGTTARTVLIRAAGPELANHGVNAAAVLSDPQLTVYNAAGASILSNDNWGVQTSGGPPVGPVADSVSAFRFAASSNDAALVATLSPGSYTVHVRGAGAGTGIALAEIYDVSGDNATSRLINISTRGYLATGASIMIPGIVVGEGSRRLLVRAAGPGLIGKVPASVTTLPDPVIRVVDRLGNEIATNDNWGFTPNDNWGSADDSRSVSTAVRATSAFPFADYSTDAALVVALPPGLYTVLVSDKNGASGLAIVEAYELD